MENIRIDLGFKFKNGVMEWGCVNGSRSVIFAFHFMVKAKHRGKD